MGREDRDGISLDGVSVDGAIYERGTQGKHVGIGPDLRGIEKHLKWVRWMEILVAEAQYRAHSDYIRKQYGLLPLPPMTLSSSHAFHMYSMTPFRHAFAVLPIINSVSIFSSFTFIKKIIEFDASSLKVFIIVQRLHSTVSQSVIRSRMEPETHQKTVIMMYTALICPKTKQSPVRLKERRRSNLDHSPSVFRLLVRIS